MNTEKWIHWILGAGGTIILLGTWFLGDSGHWPGVFTLQKTIMSGTIWGGLMLLGLVLMISTEKALEALAARVVAANWWMHFDQSQTPAIVDGLEAYELGGCLPRKFPIHIPGNKGTLLVMPDACDWSGDNLVVNAVVKEVPEPEMPPTWLASLKAQDKKAPWFVGIYPAIVHMRAHAVNVKIHDVQLAAIKANRAEGMVKELLKGDRMMDSHWNKRLEHATAGPMKSAWRHLLDGDSKRDQPPPREDRP